MINLIKAYYTLYSNERNEAKKELLKFKMIAFYNQNKTKLIPLDTELSAIATFILFETLDKK